MAESMNKKKQIKDAPASYHCKGIPLGLYETNDKRTLDKEYAICKNCLSVRKRNSNTINQ